MRVLISSNVQALRGQQQEREVCIPSGALVQHRGQALVEFDNDLHAELGLGIDAINKGSDELACQVHLLDRCRRKGTGEKEHIQSCVS